MQVKPKPRKRSCHESNRQKEHYQPMPSDEKLKFGLLNVRSIQEKTEAFVDMVSNYQLDVIALTETWLYEEDDVTLGKMRPPDFKLFHEP